MRFFSKEKSSFFFGSVSFIEFLSTIPFGRVAAHGAIEKASAHLTSAVQKFLETELSVTILIAFKCSMIQAFVFLSMLWKNLELSRQVLLSRFCVGQSSAT
jgi:hypothetical protein